MPTKSIAIRLPEELYQYLQARAEKEHRTLSNLIISILLNDKPQKIKRLSDNKECFCLSCGFLLDDIPNWWDGFHCTHCGKSFKFDEKEGDNK